MGRQTGKYPDLERLMKDVPPEVKAELMNDQRDYGSSFYDPVTKKRIDPVTVVIKYEMTHYVLHVPTKTVEFEGDEESCKHYMDNQPGFLTSLELCVGKAPPEFKRETRD